MWKIIVGLSLIFSCTSSLAQNTPTPPQPPTSDHLYNIILIISDQETYKLANAPGYQLPAREAFARHGVTFKNHYAAAAMCSPSRAALLTGEPPQTNGVFDQMEYSFVPALNPKRPNMGSVLKGLGYRTAYFGKFEMAKELLINVKNTINYSTLAQPYGFDDFNPQGDVGGNPQQGYKDDVAFVGEAVHWLRENQAVAMKTHQPFFMVVSLLNPHDIMFADANLPNSPLAQKSLAPVILPPPINSIYQKQWQFDLPVTLQDSLSAPGMPPALLEYQTGWARVLGFIPTDRTDMWKFYYNYYLNAIRDNDKSMQQIVDALNEMDLWDNTVIIVTADHGDMGGAHGGLRGKGPMAYEENAHIPLIIAHPKAQQGSSSTQLTSHLDLLPTLVGLTGLPEKDRTTVTKNFPGHDFSSLITNSVNPQQQAIRQAILFNYVGISTIDSSYLSKKMLSSFEHKPLPSLTEINLGKRGFLSFVYDGRYKFARYYSPNAFNVPNNLEEILKYNDIQLFDLQTDPNEKVNLALEPEKNKNLILKMNEVMNKLMAAEVGVNNGGFLPQDVRPKTLPITFPST